MYAMNSSVTRQGDLGDALFLVLEINVSREVERALELTAAPRTTWLPPAPGVGGRAAGAEATSRPAQPRPSPGRTVQRGAVVSTVQEPKQRGRMNPRPCRRFQQQR
jgi:hypothetical protein